MIKTKIRTAAIVLAAGQGKRMQSDCRKQYMLMGDKPVLYYSLRTFQESFLDEIILVVNAGEEAFVREQYLNTYRFTKIAAIVPGGKERYHSVAAGLNAITACDYCFIHDSARPFVTEEILNRAFQTVQEEKACVVGMPVKDTIKIADTKGYVDCTPDRNLVWAVQTPQVFAFDLVQKAYSQLIRQEKQLLSQNIHITDDAMVVETFSDVKVKLVEGSYDNIKITTPDDLILAEKILHQSDTTGKHNGKH